MIHFSVENPNVFAYFKRQWHRWKSLVKHEVIKTCFALTEATQVAWLFDCEINFMAGKQ